MAACLLATSACLATETTGPSLQPTPPDDLTSATVSRVIDGDSIDLEVDGETREVRMIGINANEQGECYSEEARDYLADRVTDATVGVHLVATDQFGRALMNVWLGEDLVNLTLVASGLAIAQTPDLANPNGAHLIAAEETAYESGMGLWSADACGSAGPVPDVGFDIEGSVIDPPGPDGDRLDDEYVVLVNDGEDAVEIAGWTLRDESSRNRMVFPEDTTIPPGERLEISSGCIGRISWCAGVPIWNNDGDMALLLDEYGTVVDRARY